MKEMLFIMVAILVPPTLTYLGFVGESHARRAELTWQPPVAGDATAATELSGRAQQDDPLCWYESSF
jgi:hypothetical protein